MISGYQMKLTWLVVALAVFSAAPSFAQDARAPIEATTAAGDKVRLLPNGRWEFVDAQKAAAAREVAQTFPENQGCPPGAQGGFFGVGRCIMPGDKDYNRGSLGRR